jgi:hypothetical protein
MINPKNTVCDACRKLIRSNDRRRLINGFTLHADEFCFTLYTEKVKNGVLRIQALVNHKN